MTGTVAGGPADDRRARERRGVALAVIATAQLMVMLDMTIVNVALPSIQRELHFSSTNLTWVVDAYVLVFGGFLLLGGRAGDLYGRTRIFAGGVALFTASSLVGGLATGQAGLIAARSVQGLGAALLAPGALALVAAIFPEGHERTRAMAVYAAMTGAGGALGLVIGGLLVEVSSWRWVLFVNVPIGTALLIGTVMVLPRIDGHHGRLDVLGALTVSGGMSLLVFGLVRAPKAGWTDAVTLGAFAGAVALLAAFVVTERRTREPLIPLGFLVDRNRSAGYLVILLVGGAMLSLLFFLTQFLQEVLGYSPLVTGVAYLPIPAMVASTSLLLSRLRRHPPVRALLTIGPLLIALGLWWASRLTAGSSYLHVFTALVLAGLGMGLSFVPLTLNAVSGVEPHRQGLASSLLNTGQQIGGALVLAVLVTVSATVTRHAVIGSPAGPGSLVHASIHGFQAALTGGALAALAASVLAAALLRSPTELPVGSAAVVVGPAPPAHTEGRS